MRTHLTGMYRDSVPAYVSLQEPATKNEEFQHECVAQFGQVSANIHLYIHTNPHFSIQSNALTIGPPSSVK